MKFAEPQDMPTEIEMEPATGKALQEFVRYQSVAYRTPALISLLVEPGYRIDGERAAGVGADARDHLPAGVLPRPRSSAADGGHRRCRAMGLGEVAAARG